MTNKTQNNMKYNVNTKKTKQKISLLWIWSICLYNFNIDDIQVTTEILRVTIPIPEQCQWEYPTTELLKQYGNHKAL